ncbi:MAG: type I-E CRISPR-associated protein Cas7/Cse4/CasC, partial [Bacillota bacterium]
IPVWRTRGRLRKSHKQNYKYFSLDFNALVDNLAGPQPDPSAGKAAQEAYREGLEEAKKVAARTVTAFLKAAVFTTPTGKQNSFAAHQLPDGILVEVRPLPTPVSYANAFVKPAQAHGQVDLVEDSLRKLAEHVELLTRKFSLRADPRLWFCTREVAIAGTTPCETFDELLSALLKVVAG